MAEPLEDDGERGALARFAATGEEDAVGSLLEGYRPRLRRLVDARMEPLLRARCDASDILQETFVEVTCRLPAYAAERDDGDHGAAMPFFLWVRFLAGQKLAEHRRRHLGAERRAAGREVALGGLVAGGAFPPASSLMLAGALAASGATPSEEALGSERRGLVERALDELTAEDREVLVLRHFEHLKNREIAHLLGLSEGGASLRHLRALGRLQEVLQRAGVDYSGLGG